MIELLPTILQTLFILIMLLWTIFMLPRITAKQIAAVVEAFSPTISRAMGTLGEKSGEARKARADSEEIKQFEADMIEGLLEKGLPEIELAREFGLISDEKVEWIKAHPDALMVLIERWLPKIKQLMSMRKSGGFNEQTQKYDF